MQFLRGMLRNERADRRRRTVIGMLAASDVKSLGRIIDGISGSLDLCGAGLIEVAGHVELAGGIILDFGSRLDMTFAGDIGFAGIIIDERPLRRLTTTFGFIQQRTDGDGARRTVAVAVILRTRGRLRARLGRSDAQLVRKTFDLRLELHDLGAIGLVQCGDEIADLFHLQPQIGA